jgi:hypothetical protein
MWKAAIDTTGFMGTVTVVSFILLLGAGITAKIAGNAATKRSRQIAGQLSGWFAGEFGILWWSLYAAGRYNADFETWFMWGSVALAVCVAVGCYRIFTQAESKGANSPI